MQSRVLGTRVGLIRDPRGTDRAKKGCRLSAAPLGDTWLVLTKSFAVTRVRPWVYSARPSGTLEPAPHARPELERTHRNSAFALPASSDIPLQSAFVPRDGRE